MRSAALVLSTGWPAGQITSTAHPALARAITRRAVENHRLVVATKTVGFTLVQASASLTPSRNTSCLWSKAVGAIPKAMGGDLRWRTRIQSEYVVKTERMKQNS